MELWWRLCLNGISIVAKRHACPCTLISVTFTLTFCCKLLFITFRSRVLLIVSMEKFMKIHRSFVDIALLEWGETNEMPQKIDSNMSHALTLTFNWIFSLISHRFVAIRIDSYQRSNKLLTAHNRCPNESSVEQLRSIDCFLFDSIQPNVFIFIYLFDRVNNVHNLIWLELSNKNHVCR